MTCVHFILKQHVKPAVKTQLKTNPNSQLHSKLKQDSQILPKLAAIDCKCEACLKHQLNNLINTLHFGEVKS